MSTFVAKFIDGTVISGCPVIANPVSLISSAVSAGAASGQRNREDGTEGSA